jgi:hypothetical protein
VSNHPFFFFSFAVMILLLLLLLLVIPAFTQTIISYLPPFGATLCLSLSSSSPFPFFALSRGSFFFNDSTLE